MGVRSSVVSVSLCHLCVAPRSLGVLWVAITRNVNICVGKIKEISIRECSCRDTASLRFTDTRQVIGARLDVGVCLCGSCMVPRRLAEH